MRCSGSSAMAAACVVAIAASRSAWAAPTPVAHWKLDETSGTTVLDSAGSYNGTNNGATINPPGQIGTAYSLDGVDDWLECGAAGDFGLTEFTVMAWVMPNDDITENTFGDPVVAKENGGGGVFT